MTALDAATERLATLHGLITGPDSSLERITGLVLQFVREATGDRELGPESTWADANLGVPIRKAAYFQRIGGWLMTNGFTFSNLNVQQFQATRTFGDSARYYWSKCTNCR